MPCDNRCIGDDVFPAPCATCTGRVSGSTKGEQSASIAGLAGAWSKELPTEQGWYWWWNEDPDSEPVPVSILKSGVDGRCFASMGQLGWTRAQNVEDMGGWWMRMVEPELPAC
jgi:hypothetical protein